MTKTKYQVYDDTTGKWETCTKADPQPSGWLHYQLRDDTNGIARPGKWRQEMPTPAAGR